MSMKTFLEEHDRLKISIQQLGIHGGGFMIEVYNTTYDFVEPIFKHFISNYDISNLKIDFETIIMTPIVNWWDERDKHER